MAYPTYPIPEILQELAGGPRRIADLTQVLPAAKLNAEPEPVRP